MATLTVEIDKEKDLPGRGSRFLTQMGLKFEVADDADDDDWGDLSESRN